jgi:hypothetical protein
LSKPSNESTEGNLDRVAKRLIDRFLPADDGPQIERLLVRFGWALLGVASTFFITFAFLVGQSFPALPEQPRPLTDFIALLGSKRRIPPKSCRA